MAAALDLHALDDQLVSSPPPLRDQRGVGERLPDALDRCVEDPLYADLAISRGGDYCGLRGCAHDEVPFVRSRKSRNRSRRASSICSYRAIHSVSFSSRRGPSVQCRTRPTFSVVTSPAPSGDQLKFTW
jgi:hypothetical protein